jgi:hypothetical protein
MNSWSRTRKRIVLGIVIFFVVVLIGLPAFLLFYRAPTCFDGKMNGDERGVDCGGSCQLLCSAESVPLILKGDVRVLTLTDGVYQVAALVENPNQDAEIYRAGYTIKVFDNTSPVPLYTIEGEAYIPKGSAVAIFEGPFTVEGDAMPRRAILEWKADSLVWRKNTAQTPNLLVRNRNFSRLNETPRLEAVIENQTLETISNIDLTAFISDADGNIFAASKTFVEYIEAGRESPIVFTWPRPFEREIVDINIVVRTYPDRSFIR